MRAKKITFILIFVIGSAIGCSKEGNTPGDNPNPPMPTENSCDGVNAKFAADVFPLIQTKCATSSACHGAGSTNGPGALTSLGQIKNAASNIKSAVGSGRMPLGGSLSAVQIRQISCWVDNGALDN
jgi:hypothetical protein